MANTIYRSVVPVTLANQKTAFEALSVFINHCTAWGLQIVQITRPTSGVNNGYIVVTVNNPIPADQVAHLSLTGPI